MLRKVIGVGFPIAVVCIPEMDRRTTLENRHFQQAIFWSLVCHVAMLTLLPKHWSASTPKEVEISLISLPREKSAVLVPPPQQKQPMQMVAPSEQHSAEPPKDAHFLSEHDSVAEKESIRRGDPNAGNISLSRGSPRPPSPKSVAEKASPAPQKVHPSLAKESPAPSRALQSDKPIDLKLSPDELDKALFAKNTSEQNKSDPIQRALRNKGAEPSSDADRAKAFEHTEPFGTSGLAALFKGKRGDADYLPHIPDGDITLLNAKADHFAVFVRRVAIQVFGALRKLSWAEMSAGEIHRMQGFIDVQADMSKDGKLLRVKILDSSGSKTFDDIVVAAAKKGTWDQNPPADAVTADGQIHFIFKAKTFSRGGGAEGIREERWLILGTGLL